MKKILLYSLSLLSVCFSNAQNVGIGVPIPLNKLDVAGDVNMTGQLKVNGNAGEANQYLMKDASNNPVWGDLSKYKNQVVLDCNTIANTAGANNCNLSWPVPAGVSEIFVECRGGGGGGGNMTGGGGGGYMSARISNIGVGLTATGFIGAAGNLGYSFSGVDGVAGGTTTFNLAGVQLVGIGGGGGKTFNTFPTTVIGGQTSGGGFSVSGPSTQYVGYFGSPGGISKMSFVQINSTDFAQVVHHGDGGDAGALPGSGGKGGYKLSGGGYTHTLYASQYAIQNGGGGGSDPNGGFYGRGGRVIIRY